MKHFSNYSFFIVIIVLLSFYSYSEAQQTIEPSEGDLTNLLEKEKKLHRKIEGYSKRLSQAFAEELKDALSKRIMKQNEELANVQYEIAEKKHGIVDLNTSQDYLKVGNYIVLKRKYSKGNWVTWFDSSYGWSHAIILTKMITNTSNIVVLEARGFDLYSRYISWEDWKKTNPYNSSNVTSAMIVDMNISSTSQDALISYCNNTLWNKPYPSITSIYKSKYDTDTLYCSSLVWRAHKSSGSFVDLDDTSCFYIKGTCWDIVSPADLVIDADTKGKRFPVKW